MAIREIFDEFPEEAWSDRAEHTLMENFLDDLCERNPAVIEEFRSFLRDTSDEENSVLAQEEEDDEDEEEDDS